MIDWAKGYSTEWRIMKVDPRSWGDTDELLGVNSVKIDRDCTDDVPLLETATLDCDISVEEEFDEGWYRIEMLAIQGSYYERHDIATLLLQSGSGVIDRGYKNANIDGYSVLKPAADVCLTAGAYVPKGANAAQYIERLLSECTPAPVVLEGEFVLNDYYVFPIGTSYIKAIWSLLDAGNFVIQIHGDGSIHILPKPTASAIELSSTTANFLQPTVDYELDLSDIPNRYIAYYGGEVARAVNDSAESPTSVVTRGRYIDYIDEDPIMVNGESLETYAIRRLVELNTVFKKYSYTREYYPGVYPFSIVKGNLNRADLVGDFTVLGQTLTCGKGLTIAEKVGMEIKEYGG